MQSLSGKNHSELFSNSDTNFSRIGPTKTWLIHGSASQDPAFLPGSDASRRAYSGGHQNYSDGRGSSLDLDFGHAYKTLLLVERFPEAPNPSRKDLPFDSESNGRRAITVCHDGGGEKGWTKA